MLELGRTTADNTEQLADFQATRWSLVLPARGDDDSQRRAALEQLCRAYWYPLDAFLRRSGKSVEQVSMLVVFLRARNLHQSPPERQRVFDGLLFLYLFRLAEMPFLLHGTPHMIRTSLAAAAAFLASAISPHTADTVKTPKKAESKPAIVAPAVAEPKAATPAERITFSQCNVEGPYIAMTFDDGPHVSQTPRLLKMLKERNIHATFFLVGQCVAQNPEIAKQIVEEGHEVANHSWNHPLLSKMAEGSVREQLQKTHDVIKQTTGVTPTLMRPPFGGFTKNQQNWTHAEWGYKCILWDVDSLDWQHRNPAKTESIIMANTRPGSIVLCHDIHKTTIDAMAATLDALIKKGFRFVTVSELIAMHKEAAPKTKAVKSLTPAEATGVATTIEDIAKPAAK